MPSYCEVALPVPLDRSFTYAVREEETALRGSRVIAPFRNEKLIGVVTGTSVEAPTDFEAKYLEAVLDDEPILSEHLLNLAEWIAGYYLAPLGEVLRSMLPLMAEVRRTVYYRITDLGRDVLATSVDGDGLNFQSNPSRRKRPLEGSRDETLESKRRKRTAEYHSRQDHSIARRVLERLASGEPPESVRFTL